VSSNALDVQFTTNACALRLLSEHLAPILEHGLEGRAAFLGGDLKRRAYTLERPVGVVSALPSERFPSPLATTMSVKVPPVSTEIVKGIENLNLAL
jgi:hypothetical protein